MNNVKVVIGANFGDEGKGLMTDYFCSRFPKDKKVLNVRFNGGAQAGHTVVTPEGKRHVFSHFGSGSFLPNVATYLDKDFIINPILFRREYDVLTSLGIYPMVYVHPSCLLTMPQDMMINQVIEKARGDKRHGSCGVGIFETEMRNKYCKKLTISNAMFTNVYNLDLDYYDAERYEKILNTKLDSDTRALMNNQNIQAHFTQDLRFFLNHVNIIGETIFNDFDNVVFEGAQGLMLDQNNLEYFPHLTPSNTGIDNVIPHLSGRMDIEVCYVTRPYLTRHGAGKLPNECLRESVNAKIDLTNHSNEWQGSLRYGKLDNKSLLNRCNADFDKLGSSICGTMSFALTHLDEDAPESLLYEIQGYKRHASIGPTRMDVQF